MSATLCQPKPQTNTSWQASWDMPGARSQAANPWKYTLDDPCLWLRMSIILRSKGSPYDDQPLDFSGSDSNAITEPSKSDPTANRRVAKSRLHIGRSKKDSQIMTEAPKTEDAPSPKKKLPKWLVLTIIACTVIFIGFMFLMIIMLKAGGD